MYQLFFLTLLFISKLSADYLNHSEVMDYACDSFQPESRNNFYMSVGGGVVFPCKNSHTRKDSNSVLFTPTTPGTSLFSLPNVVWKNRYQTGFELNGVLGYSIKPCLRVEAEFLYQDFKRRMSGSYDWKEVDAITTSIFAQNTNNLLHKASSRTNVYASLSNLYFDYKNCTPWTLSFAGGIGVAWIKSRSKENHNVLHIVSVDPPLNLTTPTSEKSTKLYGTAFAWQIKIGCKYEFNKCLSLGLNYRLFGTTQFSARGSKIITNPNTLVQAVFRTPQENIRGLLNNSINMTAEYRF